MRPELDVICRRLRGRFLELVEECLESDDYGDVKTCIALELSLFQSAVEGHLIFWRPLGSTEALLGLFELQLKVLFDEELLSVDSVFLLKRAGRQLCSKAQLNQSHVDIANLVEEELGIARMVLAAQVVSVCSLEVTVDRLHKVLVKDLVLRGKHVALSRLIRQRLVQGVVVLQRTRRLETLLLVQEEESKIHHLDLRVFLLLQHEDLKVVDELVKFEVVS